MSNELNRALAELDKLEAELTTKLEAVRAAKKALGGSLVDSGGNSLSSVQKPVKGRKRAPAGSLKIAIKAVLKKKPGMTNAEIRKAVKKTGYKWSVDDLYVSKSLTQLKAAKEILLSHNGGRFEYRLKDGSVSE
jgi:hypothetical protein